MYARNSSRDEIANVNFLYDNIVHAVQNAQIFHCYILVVLVSLFYFYCFFYFILCYILVVCMLSVWASCLN